MDAHGDAAAFRPSGGTVLSGFVRSALIPLFLTAHGFAHLAGTVTAFEAAANGESLDYLGGAWVISDPTTLRLVGTAWAVVAVAYVAAAIGEWSGWGGWVRFVAVVTVSSLLLSVLGLWAAWIGVLVDLGILAAIALTTRHA